ncbi:MAG: MlaD family protein [Phycisphaerales bacterium]
MLRRTSKNNVLAGLFLIFSLALALAVFFLLSSAWERLTVPTNKYIVRFTLADGAEGLDKDAFVKIGGEKVGSVSSWSFRKDDTSGHIIGVDVEIQVHSEIAIYENAVAYLNLPLLGSSSSINFPSVGDPVTVVSPQGNNPLLQSGEYIKGTLAPPAFLAQAGYGPEQTKQVQSIISNAEETTARMNRVTRSVEDRLEPMMAEVSTILADGRSLSGDARESFQAWRASLTAALERLNTATERVVTLLESAQAGVDETRGVVASVQGAVDENKDRIARALTNVEELTQRLKTDTYAAVMDILENGKAATSDFAQAADRIRVLVGRRATDLETTIGNARIASDQLKLTMIEVRQAPWKILAKPEGRKELENEVLYDSVRAYATAVSDLRAAAASLESITQGNGQPSELDRRTIDDITKAIDESFQKYQKAEAEFLSRWTKGN